MSGWDGSVTRWIIKDCRAALRELAASGVRVNCCVTSPPYWGMRDYGHSDQIGLEPVHDCLGWAIGNACGMCHVCNLRDVFRLVREVLSDDGTLWLNYGDCYASSGGGGRQGKTTARAGRTHTQRNLKGNSAVHGLKPKDLAMMPARMALALQADGWYLRQDIIWAKPNPMPESVKDRCTRSHEYVFLLTKQERYYYDADAIRERASPDSIARYTRGRGENHKWVDGGPGEQTIAKTFAHMLRPNRIPSGWDTGPGDHRSLVGRYASGGHNRSSGEGAWEWRNRRSVWTITTHGFSGNHFAAMPEELVRRCILAGCPEGGIVVDPFAGTGTVGAVAERCGRMSLLIEVNPDYEQFIKTRMRQRGLVSVGERHAS